VSVADHVRLPFWERVVEAAHEVLLRLVVLGFVQALNEHAGLVFSRLADGEIEPVGFFGPVDLKGRPETGIDVGLQSTHVVSPDFTVIALRGARFILGGVAAVWVAVSAADRGSSNYHLVGASWAALRWRASA
jgi:hypothetical protein